MRETLKSFITLEKHTECLFTHPYRQKKKSAVILQVSFIDHKLRGSKKKTAYTGSKQKFYSVWV